MSLSVFDTTLTAIKVLRSFPPSGCSKSFCCGGHTVDEILSQWQTVFPTVPITEDHLNLVLTAQAKRGVFRRLCNNAGEPCFGVNTMMVQSNYQNLIYVQQQEGYNGFIPGDPTGCGNGITVAVPSGSASYTTNSGSCQGVLTNPSNGAVFGGCA